MKNQSRTYASLQKTKFVQHLSSAMMATGLAFLLIGCEPTQTTSLPSPDYSQLAQVTTDFPPVVKIFLPGLSGTCSGTFVSPEIILTAAHCLSSSGTYTVVTDFGGIHTTSNFEKYGTGSVGDAHDIGVLIMNTPIAGPTQVYPMGESVFSGDEVRLVGYGCGPSTSSFSTEAGAGIKRTGTNTIATLDHFIHLIVPFANGNSIIGAQNRAGSCFGDSGGPALKNFGTEALPDYRVVGTAHAGGIGSSYILSDYTDMTRSDNRGFLNTIESMYSVNILGID